MVIFIAASLGSIARLLLEELCVSRIEIASARVSQGEQEAVRRIAEWAASKGYSDRLEALGFIDGGISLDWLGDAGCRVVNLLTKGALKHCREQLRRTPEEHLGDIRATIDKAVARGMRVNIYLEDWSNGMQHSPEYVYAMLDALAAAPVQRKTGGVAVQCVQIGQPGLVLDGIVRLQHHNASLADKAVLAF